MTKTEARKLKAGERVVIWRGKPYEVTGTVVRLFPHGYDKAVIFDWDDGERSTIVDADCEVVEVL